MISDESSLWRESPHSPYRRTGRNTTASPAALAATMRILRSAGQREAACLWLGRFDDNENGRVEAIVVPKQFNRPRNYSIASGAMEEVAALGRPQRWTLVAAIHSHPGPSVEHSSYDDEMTPSRSALSIVFASYGADQGTWASGVGVHEFIDDYWHLLPMSDAKERVRFAAELDFQLFDLR